MDELTRAGVVFFKTFPVVMFLVFAYTLITERNNPRIQENRTVAILALLAAMQSMVWIGYVTYIGSPPLVWTLLTGVSLVIFIPAVFFLKVLRTPEAEVATPTPQPDTRVAYTEAVANKLVVPRQFLQSICEAIYAYTGSEMYKTLPPLPDTLAAQISDYARILPKNIKVGTGKPWNEYWTLENQHLRYSYLDIPSYLRNALDSIKIELVIPDELRTQHMMVLAGAGFGKSQLFQSMILADRETDAALIVIDSQNDLINKLATRLDDPIVIDPIACPPALNIMKIGDPALLEYIFGALDAKMTSRQGMVYRFLCKHVIKQDGTIADLLTILQNPEQVYDPENDAARAFFAEYKNPKGEYRDTRKEIMTRLLTLMENSAFNTMMAQPDLKINIAEAIEQGRTVLINTAKPDVGNAGAALFGRFWLALTLQAVMKGSRKRVNLYVDEFSDYASDDLETIFSQARKYNLAMTVAFQSLAQLPERLKAVMLSNTSIKFAGGVSAEDRGNLARQMDCEPDFIAKAKRGNFVAWFRDMGVTYFPVEFGRLEKLPELEHLTRIHHRMTVTYGKTDPVLDSFRKELDEHFKLPEGTKPPRLLTPLTGTPKPSFKVDDDE